MKYVGYFECDVEAAHRHDEEAKKLYESNPDMLTQVLNFPDVSPQSHKQNAYKHAHLRILTDNKDSTFSQMGIFVFRGCFQLIFAI